MGDIPKFPLVSIITPVYNRASFLDETIESVLSQDYPNIEYIVLDDGSKDNSLEVMQKYGDRIRIGSHENMGETRTVNKGFSMANGEIIGVVNSDDPLLPGAIREIVKLMVTQSQLVVVYPDWNMIDLHGKVLEHVKTFEYSYINMLRWHHCMPGPGTFFRREVVEELGGRDTQFRYVGDFDFWLRAGLIGPFARVPHTLATFRVHPGSASVSQQGDLMAKEHIILVNKVFSLPNFPSNLRKLKREAYSSAFYIAGVVCGNNPPSIQRRYLLKALNLCPWKYLFEYRNRLFVIANIVPWVGNSIRVLRAFLKPLKILRSKNL